MSAYYNENDKATAEWLRQLIGRGLIAPGVVDDRSITEVTPADLKGFTQHHFFAGIGTFSYALRRAGWPDSRPIWTGSCPCQPFSSAGTHKGLDDDRHLWPAFFGLIRSERPSVVVGEQVASADVIGKVRPTHAGKDSTDWIDVVQADLEGALYQFGSVVAPSAGVGAPHIRLRTWWVGISEQSGLERLPRPDDSVSKPRRVRENTFGPAASTILSGGMAYTSGQRGDGVEKSARAARWSGSQAVSRVIRMGHSSSATSERNTGELPEAQRETSRQGRANGNNDHRYSNAGEVIGMADPQVRTQRPRNGQSGQGHEREIEDRGRRVPSGLGVAYSDGRKSRSESSTPSRHRDSTDPTSCPTPMPGPTNGFWADPDWIFCRDNKWRPVEPGTSPLVASPSDRVVRSGDRSTSIDARETGEARVLRLKGYGNGINAESARVFIECVKELVDGS